MDGSLKQYLGTHKSAALEKYLDGLMWRCLGQYLCRGYGVWPLDDNYRYMEIDAAGDNDSICWTHVVISVDGVIDGHAAAAEILRAVDEEIDGTLSPGQKPPRVSYSLDDGSNTTYRAKSRRIQGTSPVGAEGPKPRVREAEGDSDLTPPASPREGAHIVKTRTIEVELDPENRIKCSALVVA